jgi:hypothetical protein
VAHRSVEILIGRLITDETFRAAFVRDAAATLTGFIESGYELTSLERAVLQTTQADLWARVAEQIDPRLQKASFAVENAMGAKPHDSTPHPRKEQ